MTVNIQVNTLQYFLLLLKSIKGILKMTVQVTIFTLTRSLHNLTKLSGYNLFLLPSL